MDCVYDCEWITNFSCISECYRLDAQCNNGNLSRDFHHRECLFKIVLVDKIFQMDVTSATVVSVTRQQVRQHKQPQRRQRVQFLFSAHTLIRTDHLSLISTVMWMKTLIFIMKVEQRSSLDVEPLWWTSFIISVDQIPKDDRFEPSDLTQTFWVVLGFLTKALFSIQFLKIEDCTLVRQNELPFDFLNGACNTFIYPKPVVLLCFDYYHDQECYT